IGREDRPPPRRRYRLDELWRQRRDRRPRGRTARRGARPALAAAGLRSGDLPDHARAGRIVLPQRPHHRDGRPPPRRGNGHGLAPRGTRRPSEYRVQGAFLMTARTTAARPHWPLMKNNILRADLDRVCDLLQQPDPVLTQAVHVRAFEEEWSGWLGVRH